MTISADQSEDPGEIPVGDLVVDLVDHQIRLPHGETWGRESDLDNGLISEAGIRDLPLSVVTEALGLLSEHVDDGAPDGWYLETDPPNRVYEYELHDGVALESRGVGDLVAVVGIGLPSYVDDAFEDGIEDLIAPMLRYAGAVGRHARKSAVFIDEAVATVRFESTKGRSVGELIDLADHVRALMIAARSGQPHKQVALGLALAGHTATFVGQSESSWLEAKGQLWDLDKPAGKAEVAKDLSAMANAEGGLVLIPAQTTLASGREVITEVLDMQLDRINVKQIRDVLSQRVFPPLPELVTEVVPTTEGRGILIVAVGQHLPDNWPHLVVGDPDSTLPVQSVSAWVRDSDRNRALTAPEFHALLRRRSAD